MDNMAKFLEKTAQKVIISRRFSPYDFKASLEEAFALHGYREQYAIPGDILIICLNAIGDSVLYSAMVRELRRNYPQCRITIIVTPLVYHLWELCPYVNRVLRLPYHPSEPFAVYFPRFVEFCQKELLSRHFSLSLCPQWSDDKRPMNLLAYMSGARERYGISDKSILAYQNTFSLIDQWESLLTHPVVTPVSLLHEAQRALYLVESLGGTVSAEQCEVWTGQEDEFHSRQGLGVDKYVVLGIGAGAANRKYPLEQWVVALTDIYAQYHIPFAVCGGKAEEEDGKYLQQNLPGGCIINMTGISLRETAAVIKNSRLYLGNVTGLMHMAAAAGRPVITLFREAKERPQAPAGIFSESTRFAPWQAEAIVLQPAKTVGKCGDSVIYGGCHAEEAHCIAAISPQEIVKAFQCIYQG